MAYFSNGTEGMMFEEHNCSECVHRNGPDGTSGCAVWNAHLLFAYQLCNEEEDEGKQILDMLIPEDKDGFPDKCAMFYAGEAVPTPEEKREAASKHVMPAMREWAEKHGVL